MAASPSSSKSAGVAPQVNVLNAIVTQESELVNGALYSHSSTMTACNDAAVYGRVWGDH